MKIKLAEIYSKHKTILLMLIILVFFSASFFGCAKGKKQIPSSVKPETKFIGCQLFDKLPGNITSHLEVNYGNKIKLLGIRTNKKDSSNRIELAYFWQILEDLGPYQTIFIHFTDQKGNILFQNDHNFCKDYLLREKSKNKFIKESFLIYMPESLVNTKVDMKLGIYDPNSGSRLNIESKKGILTDYQNSAVLAKKIF